MKSPHNGPSVTKETKHRGSLGLGHILIGILLILAGISGYYYFTAPSPEKVALKYFERINEGEFSKVSKMLCTRMAESSLTFLEDSRDNGDYIYYKNPKCTTVDDHTATCTAVRIRYLGDKIRASTKTTINFTVSGNKVCEVKEE